MRERETRGDRKRGGIESTKGREQKEEQEETTKGRKSAKERMKEKTKEMEDE